MVHAMVVQWYRGENQIVYSKLRTNLSIIDKIEKAISAGELLAALPA